MRHVIFYLLIGIIAVWTAVVVGATIEFYRAGGTAAVEAAASQAAGGIPPAVRPLLETFWWLAAQFAIFMWATPTAAFASLALLVRPRPRQQIVVQSGARSHHEIEGDANGDRREPRIVPSETGA